jgi:cytosine/adenosine deaminase-related metal-dependent hydrolase
LPAAGSFLDGSACSPYPTGTVTERASRSNRPPPPRLIRNLWLCRAEGGSILPVFGDLLLEAGRIRELRRTAFRRFLHSLEGSGQSGGLPRAVAAAAAGATTGQAARQAAGRPAGTELDAEGRVATPPLVNFHEHLYSRLAKGFSPAGPTESFIGILENLWWRLDRALDLDMVGACARLGAAEAIRSGVTCLYDHHASPGAVEGSLEAIAGALGEAGLRGVLCFETSDRYGPEGVRAALEVNRRFLQTHREGETRGLLGLHAPFTLSDQTLEAAARIRDDTGTGIHIHLGEDRHDPEHCRARYGLAPAERLRRFGLLTPDGILAHAIHLAPEEREAIAAGGAAVAYNPDSNLNNAVGLAQFSALPVEVPVLCGTDGMHGNPGRSLKQLFLLARHQGFATGAAFDFARKIYFDQARFARRAFPDHPSLSPGERADLVVWEYRPPTPFTPDTFWGHFLYGVLESVPALVLQGGRPLLSGGRVQTLDEAAVGAAAARQGERLFERLEAPRNG